MASASSTSARSLFSESKLRLADRVQVNVNIIASVTRQINRGSKSSEALFQLSKQMAALEHAMDNTEENLKKMQVATHHLTNQFDSVQRHVCLLEEVKEQVCAMQR